MASSDGIQPDVARDYALQVQSGTGEDAAVEIAAGLIDSTREVLRVAVERGAEEGKSGRPVRAAVDEMDKVFDGEMAKLAVWSGGWALVILRRRQGHLRRLADRYPARLGWLHRWLDWLVGPDEGVVG